jgi:hypothetical protein
MKAKSIEVRIQSRVGDENFIDRSKSEASKLFFIRLRMAQMLADIKNA